MILLLLLTHTRTHATLILESLSLSFSFSGLTQEACEPVCLYKISLSTVVVFSMTVRSGMSYPPVQYPAISLSGIIDSYTVWYVTDIRLWIAHKYTYCAIHRRLRWFLCYVFNTGMPHEICFGANMREILRKQIIENIIIGYLVKILCLSFSRLYISYIYFPISLTGLVVKEQRPKSM